VMGILANTEKANFITKFIESKDIPCFAVFRINILDEPSLVDRLPLTSSTNPREIIDLLKNIEASFKILEKEELKVKRNVDTGLQVERQLAAAIQSPVLMNPFIFPMNNQINDGFFVGMPNSPGQQPRQMDPAYQQKLEEDRLLRRIQEEEFKEVERKIKEQKEKGANELAKKKREAEEKIQKEKEAEMEKQKKKENIPAELDESDPNAILIIFRLPDGSRIQRRFDRNNKVQILYDYVDVSEVTFEHSNVYDLIQQHPFVSLTDKEKAINDIFEGSNHESLHVREQV